MNRPLLLRIGRRLRVLAACIDGPADVWLALRMLGWRLVLPVLKWALPLPRLVQLMWWGGEPRASTSERKQRIVTLAHGLSGPASIPALDNCLERSLLVYRYLSKAGAEPELVVGFSRRSGAVQGHTWVNVDDQEFCRREESAGEFETVVCFGPAGAIKRSTSAR
jgi:Transglutaminase-like superfamily